jgi:carboxyl-terminal processing protease
VLKRPRFQPTTAPEPGTAAKIRRATLAMVMLVVFCGGVAVDRFAWQGGGDAGAASSLQDLPQFQTLVETWDAIHQHYVDTSAINDQALIYGASRGMVDALGDTGHSTFLDPEEAKLFEDATQGEFVGIGVQLDFSTGRPVIITAIDGSPAAQAGLRSRDVITAINGQSTEGMSDSQASELLRGNADTKVELTIERPSDGSTFSRTITRQKITIKPVSWSMLPDGVGLIRISEFSTGTTDGLKEALKQLNAEGATSLVLDLRDNPGGLVNEAIGVASQFMEEGTPIYQYQERDQQPKPVRTVGHGLGTKLPMAVLVNQGSASAAEIVASGLHDNGRAKLYGERTFGTGTVLTPFPLNDGSVVVLGIGLWLTPDGQQIWHKGVQPDVKVELAANADPLHPIDSHTISATDFNKSHDDQLKDAFNGVTAMRSAVSP